MINNWELTQSHFEGKIVVIAKTEETNLLTHKAEDGLAEADDPEDEEDEEDEEEEEEDTATLGDEELKMQILQMPQFTQTREKSLSQKAQMSCFSRKYNSAPWVAGWWWGWWGGAGKASQGRSFRRRVEGGGLTK